MGLYSWVKKFIKKFRFDHDFDEKKLDFAINVLIREEMNELFDALERRDSEEIVDALGDIVWLCIKLMFQLRISPRKVFDEIGRANLSKERGVKPGRESSGGFDVIKPEGWKGPDHSDNHGILDEILENKK